MRSAYKCRKGVTTELFKNEIFGVARSISLGSMSLYQGVKADLLKGLSTAVKHSNIQYSSALTIDLSGIINAKANMNFRTFKEFSDYLYSYILPIGKYFKRCDVVCDRYFKRCDVVCDTYFKRCGVVCDRYFEGSIPYP